MIKTIFTLLRGWYRQRTEAVQRFRQVSAICQKTECGIFKRIDENRELFELIQRKSPELIERCFWIRGWLESQDRFLVELAQAVGTKNSLMSPHFPRAIPNYRAKADTPD